jgi:hypothetical protein
MRRPDSDVQTPEKRNERKERTNDVVRAVEEHIEEHREAFEELARR